VGEDDQLAFESVELSWIAAPAEVTALVDGAILVDVAAGRLPDGLPSPGQRFDDIEPQAERRKSLWLFIAPLPPADQDGV
jgi:hypothetical protein